MASDQRDARRRLQEAGARQVERFLTSEHLVLMRRRKVALAGRSGRRGNGKLRYSGGSRAARRACGGHPRGQRRGGSCRCLMILTSSRCAGADSPERPVGRNRSPATGHSCAFAPGARLPVRGAATGGVPGSLSAIAARAAGPFAIGDGGGDMSISPISSHLLKILTTLPPKMRAGVYRGPGRWPPRMFPCRRFPTARF